MVMKMEFDFDSLADQVTKELLRRLSRDAAKGVLVLGGCPDGIVSEPYSAVREAELGDGAFSYVLLPAAAYRALAGVGGGSTREGGGGGRNDSRGGGGDGRNDGGGIGGVEGAGAGGGDGWGASERPAPACEAASGSLAANASPAHGGSMSGTASGGGDIDLTGKRLLHERDLREHGVRSGSVVRVSRRAIVTALASDYAKGHRIRIAREQ
jgi:hypothetical protein